MSIENKTVVFETRICPKALAPVDANGNPRSDTHVAFAFAETVDAPQAEWFVCTFKDGKPHVFSSNDHSTEERNPWGNEWANVYRDFCLYSGNDLIGYRRIQDRIIAITGVMLDFDSHSCSDMPLDNISRILLSDEFAKEVPFSQIVFSGNGYQLHLPVQIQMNDEARREKLAKYNDMIVSLMDYFRARWSLNPDPSCKDPNRLHRLPNTWNTKAVKSFGDTNARKAVAIVKTKPTPLAESQEFIHKIMEQYPPPQKHKIMPGQNASADVNEIKDALSFINPANLCYQDWLSIGMALHAWDNEQGLAVWVAWSQQDAARYDSNVIDYKWGTFSQGGGVTMGTLFHLAYKNGWQRSAQDSKPIILLPGNGVNLTDCAGQLGKLLKATNIIYRRGNSPLRLQDNDFGHKNLYPVSDKEACSLFEHVAALKIVRKNDIAHAVASTEAAGKILACPDFLKELPRITIVTNCPVLVENEQGILREITGYDEATGILSFGRATVAMEPTVAVTLLKQITSDFNFVNPGDRSRALASLISPALVMGGLVQNRAPIDMTEADQSQAGKGFRHKLIVAVYNEAMAVITGKKGGIGGLEESFDTALVRGKPFILFDNLRGKIESTKLESFMTEDCYHARIPFRADTEVDPRRHVIHMTSNKAEATKDLAERLCITRIRKHTDDYRFAEYPEGDILTHIKANQPQYLGAVHAIVRAWHAAGKPRSPVNIINSFAVWYAVLDWIVTMLMKEDSIITGHREAQLRATNPMLGWLREVALAVKAYQKLGRELRTSELLDIIELYEIEIPFIKEIYDTSNDDDKKRILQTIGRKLHPLFATGSIMIDCFTIQQIKRHDGKIYKDITTYIFHESDPQKTQDPPKPAYTPPMDPPMKPLDPPNPPEDSNILADEFFEKVGNNLVGKEYTPSGGLGGHRRKQADASPETENTAFQDDKEYGFASNLFVDGNNSTDKFPADAESSSSSLDWP